MDGLAGFLEGVRGLLLGRSAGQEAGAGATSPDEAPLRSPVLAVASVVRTRGSTPRKVGARMLMDPLGGARGTIGGGCGEAEVFGKAQRTLATGEPQLIEVRLLEEEGFESASICGGVLDVFVERLGSEIGGVDAAEFFDAVDTLRADGGAAVATIVAGEEMGRKILVDQRGDLVFQSGREAFDSLVREAGPEAIERRTPLREVGPSGEVIFVEPLVEMPEVVVVGAGHVGAAVTEVAARAGFRVVVLDDRADFANPIRLPDATQILVGDPRVRLGALDAHPDRHIVLVTRGHRLDAECLEVALDLRALYVGMIGSRRRVRRIREWLAERGVEGARLEKLHAPIGLDIGAETPGEIAVAIVAEIIAARSELRRKGG